MPGGGSMSRIPGNNRIIRVKDMKGAGWTAYGTFGSAAGQLKHPAGVAVDARGRISIADQGNSRIVQMDDMKGAGWTTFGKRGSGVGELKDPAGIVLDPADGCI